ncbi:MAG: hypothetical protein Kow0092_06930 [Deferrisomatales bacterium]
MKTKLLWLGVLAAGLSGSAWAGYRSMADEWGAYEPGAFYRSYSRPAPPAEGAARPADRDFQRQVRELEQARERWTKALAAAEGEPGFFRPEPSLLEALGGAAADAKAAERALAEGFDLPTLEVLAWVRSPGIAAAEKRLRAAIESYAQVWNLDEILRQYTAFTEELMTGVGPMKGREPVEMRFPFPGVLALKGQIVEQEVRAARERLEAARRTAITQARQTYWNLLFTRRAQAITEQMLALLRHLESVAKTRYEAGETSFQDVIKVRIQRETVEEDLTTLREQQRNLEVKIREVVDLAPESPVGAPAPARLGRKVPELEPLYTLALERKQELRRLRAAVRKTELMIEMAETRIYPAYTLNVSLYADEAVNEVGTFRKREPFPVTPAAAVGAGLPKMPWYGANDAYLRETRQKLEALRRELARMENATVSAVRQAWFSLDRAAREEALYADSVVNLSEAALDVSSRGYEAGEVTFADVIASYTTWLQANLALERRRSDAGVAAAGLDAAVGVSGAGR